ncbi:unnamed protein product, partial [Hapterophycus canaliculatus]
RGDDDAKLLATISGFKQRTSCRRLRSDAPPPFSQAQRLHRCTLVTGEGIIIRGRCEDYFRNSFIFLARVCAGPTQYLVSMHRGSYWNHSRRRRGIDFHACRYYGALRQRREYRSRLANGE